MRARFEERFCIERVAEDYLKIYRALPGVRRATRSLAAPLPMALPSLAVTGAPIFQKAPAHPGMERFGPSHAAPSE